MNVRTISIYEDTCYKIDLNDDEKEEILKLKGIIASNNIRLEVDGTFMISHYVGFLTTRKIKIQVLPKILNMDSSIYERNYELENKAIELLFDMMSYCDYLEVKELPEDRQVCEFSSDILEIFISIFIESLLSRLKRSMNRSYIEVEDNSIFIKGKILVSETKRRNSFREHFHYIRYEEFTHNNLLNRIFKTVSVKLLSVSRHKGNVQGLKQIISVLNETSTVNINTEIFKKVKFNRLNNVFERPFKLAEILFFNAMPGLYTGDRETYSFLIEVNHLYEKFLYKWIDNQVKDREEIRVLYQKPQKYLAGNSTFLLKPDITINHGDSVKVIIDAKYKNAGKNISQADIYQMLAYAVRYNCENIYLVYPKMLDSDIDGGILADYIIKSEILNKDISIKVCIFDLFNYRNIKIQNLSHILIY